MQKKRLNKISMAGPWITEYEVSIVEDCMRNGWNSYEYVEKFQDEFSKYHGRKFGIMTPNCTTAIHLLLTAIGITKDDEVIAPECTWIGSTAGIKYLNGKTVFCDIDEDDWCLSPASVERAITPRTKAIIVVDLYGNMPKMKLLQEIADKNGLFLIEDSAEALGSSLNGVKAGGFGIGSVFSFHRTKTLTTGEGGMLIIDDEILYQRCMFLRDHGRKKDGPAYYNYEITYKYMPSNLQAAIGYAQFQRIEELVKKKHWIFERFQEELQDIPDIQLNAEPSGTYNGVWTTALVIGKSHRLNKLQMMAKLEQMGLPARPFFYPLSSLPAYPYSKKKYENENKYAYDISNRGINLPGSLTIKEAEIVAYSNAIKKILKS